MPRESVWFVRAALLHLAMGFAIGALLLAAKEVRIVLPVAWLLGAHRDLVLLGWMAQLTLGVAYWVLPRHPTGAARGSPRRALAGWAVFNAGVVVAAVGRPAHMAAVGYVLVFVGAAVVAGGLVPRVRAFGAR